jgi:hypothetical protein
VQGDRVLNERGFSLMEALTAATVAVIAVMGLAYSFGVGRALVNRYEIARAALAEAQNQLEELTQYTAGDPVLAVGYASPPTPFRYEGVELGSQSWQVTAYDEPNLPGTVNMKRVRVVVRWQQNARGDSLVLERLWLP